MTCRAFGRRNRRLRHDAAPLTLGASLMTGLLHIGPQGRSGGVSASASCVPTSPGFRRILDKGPAARHAYINYYPSLACRGRVRRSRQRRNASHAGSALISTSRLVSSRLPSHPYMTTQRTATYGDGKGGREGFPSDHSFDKPCATSMEPSDAVEGSGTDCAEISRTNRAARPPPWAGITKTRHIPKGVRTRTTRTRIVQVVAKTPKPRP